MDLDENDLQWVRHIENVIGTIIPSYLKKILKAYGFCGSEIPW